MRRPELAVLIDGAIGYGSAFDEQFGYYADAHRLGAPAEPRAMTGRIPRRRPALAAREIARALALGKQ